MFLLPLTMIVRNIMVLTVAVKIDSTVLQQKISSGYRSIVPDKALFFSRKVLIFFLFFQENIHCGYH